MIDLAKQLREAIERSGLTRKQIADRTGVSYSAVHGFVAGTRDMTLQSASKIAEVVGLDLRPVRRGKRKG